MRLRLKALLITFAGLAAGLAVGSIFSAGHASADSFNAGRIIDDTVFLNATSMGNNSDQIQAFLRNKGGFLGSYSTTFDCSAYSANGSVFLGQASHDAYIAAGAPCGQIVPASTIIYYAAQVYGINPQAIIATLQKESSLVTLGSNNQNLIDHAMGYGCPDSTGCSTTSGSNFMYQVDNGTWALRFRYERLAGNTSYWPSSTSKTCTVTPANYYKPNLYPSQTVTFTDGNNTNYANVFIVSAATSSLYCYTPHATNNFPGCTPVSGFSYSSNIPTIGNTGQCYAGSYNFYAAFTNWFGSTLGDAFQPLTNPRWMQVAPGGAQKVYVFSGALAGSVLPAGQQIRFVDKILINGTWYLRTEYNYNDGGVYGIPQSQLVEIPWQSITPKWVTFTSDGNRSYPSSRTSVGDSLVRGTSVQVVDQITVDGNTYYRTRFNHDNSQDVGIHSRFLTDFTPMSLDGPRNFCSTTAISKVNPQTGQTVSTSTGAAMFMINKKTLINGIWYYQSSSDNGTLNFLDSSGLSDTCYVPFENPRSMVLNQNTARINPLTGSTYDTLTKGSVISLSTKVFLNDQWYYRTTYNTQNNTDAVIPASSFSEL